MQTRARGYRVFLTALGLLTVVVGGVEISGAIIQLRAWRGEPLANAAIVLLALAVFLAVGGVVLVVRGIKYQGPGA